MAEYIDRDTLLADIDEMSIWWGDAVDLDDIVANIEHMAAADVAPVRRGQWKQVSKANRAVKCTACGFTTDSARARMYRYCPDCGAKMDGGADNA
jgi:tRNA(Ile2) C34 agmatinyltransferase TiaS